MPRGRPKTIDEDKILDAVMHELWENGVKSLSLNALADRVGVSKPTLVAAFGNKDKLIATALSRYDQAEREHGAAVLAKGAPLDVTMRAYLQAVIDAFADEASPCGCFIARTSTEFSTETDGPIRRVLNDAAGARRDRMVQYLRDQNHPTPECLADFILAQTTALSAMSCGGAPKEAMESVADWAVKSLR